jgi:hypothetical protein
LGDLLRQLTQAFSGRTNIPVALTVQRCNQLPANVQVMLYRISQEALNNVTVVDNVINLAGCNFPPTLAVGQTVECIVAGVEHCQTVTNTVTASGVGASSGIGVSTNDTAAVVVLPISITCELTVNGKPHESIPCDGQGHMITNAVEVCNTGSLPLSDIAINAPDLVALGCTDVANIRLSLLPGQCTNVILCTDLVTCPPTCGLASRTTFALPPRLIRP